MMSGLTVTTLRGVLDRMYTSIDISLAMLTTTSSVDPGDYSFNHGGVNGDQFPRFTQHNQLQDGQEAQYYQYSSYGHGQMAIPEGSPYGQHNLYPAGIDTNSPSVNRGGNNSAYHEYPNNFQPPQHQHVGPGNINIHHHVNEGRSSVSGGRHNGGSRIEQQSYNPQSSNYAYSEAPEYVSNNPLVIIANRKIWI